MAVELVGNEKLQRFIQLLANLNHAAAEMLKTGSTRYLATMNDVIEEMYSIQNGSKAEEYTAIDEDAQIIYKNFDAMVAMLKSNDSDTPDMATNVTVKHFLRNIFEANVRIIRDYGLA